MSDDAPVSSSDASSPAVASSAVTEAPVVSESVPPEQPTVQEPSPVSTVEVGDSPEAEKTTTAREPEPQQTPPAASPQVHVLTSDEKNEGRAHLLQHRDEHLEKIMAHARQKKEITNDDVEKLLHVSDATASRYLKMLVAQGKLVRQGKGRGVVYVVVK